MKIRLRTSDDPDRIHFSFIEGFYRFCTDSLFHRALYFFNSLLFRKTIENTIDERRVGYDLTLTYRQWVYGRKLTRPALETFRWLSEQGFSPIALRCIVFSNCIQPNGKLCLPYKRLFITQLLTWSWLFLCVVFWFIVSIKLFNATDSFWLSLLFSCILFFVLAVMNSVYIILGIQMPIHAKAAAKLESLRKKQMPTSLNNVVTSVNQE